MLEDSAEVRERVKVPDIDQIRQLIEMMVSNDLVELSVRDGETEVTLRRPNPKGSETVFHAIPSYSGPMPAMGPSGGGAAGSTVEEAATELVEIRSPMVGTFYSAPDPESPPFVQAGSHVGPATVVCVLEAMKVFSEIKAETSGTIERVLVGNGEAVEYGQPLFLVKPS